MILLLLPTNRKRIDTFFKQDIEKMVKRIMCRQSDIHGDMKKEERQIVFERLMEVKWDQIAKKTKKLEKDVGARLDGKQEAILQERKIKVFFPLSLSF